MPHRPMSAESAPVASMSPVPSGDPSGNASAAWQAEQLSLIETAFDHPSDESRLDRQALLRDLGASIRASIATGAPSAAILLDINGFADLNAAYGPSAGDEAIAIMRGRITSVAADAAAEELRSDAITAGHLDSDHFLIVARSAPNADALRRAAARFVEALGEPLTLAGRHASVSARAAIVRIPDHAGSVTAALARGFQTLNGAARARSDGIAMAAVEEIQGIRRQAIENDLAAALNTDQIFIALQPKVHTGTGAISGAEALARWDHPERGPLPPQIFIEAAEAGGLIFDLGLRILRDSCRAAASFSSAERPFTIAVNVSPRQLSHPDFLGAFLAVIDEEGPGPEVLEIEITETALALGGDSVRESLMALKRCGIGIAIDDFGTGFSNLAALSALPADTLKIDRSLVVGAEDGGKGAALFDVALQLGRTFGMETVAEGVETRRQFDHVSARGCDFVQGFLTGRPVRADEFARRYLG